MASLNTLQRQQRLEDRQFRYALFKKDAAVFAGSKGRLVLSFCRALQSGDLDAQKASRETILEQFNTSPQLRKKIAIGMNCRNEEMGAALARLWIASWERNCRSGLKPHAEEVLVTSPHLRTPGHYAFISALSEALQQHNILEADPKREQAQKGGDFTDLHVWTLGLSILGSYAAPDSSSHYRRFARKALEKVVGQKVRFVGFGAETD